MLFCSEGLCRVSAAGEKTQMADRQQVSIHYRRLDDVTGSFGGQSLEQAIRAAMSSTVTDGPIAGHWKRRAWTSAAGGPETLLMNIFDDGGSHFFGDLTQYTTGFMQALLAMEDKQRVRPLDGVVTSEG
jgi:hypothetical protein